MRHLLWVLFLGLLALSSAQVEEQERDAAIAQLAAENAQVQARDPEVVDEDEASQKTAQGILEAVNKVVGALTPNLPGFTTQVQPEAESTDAAVVEANEAAVNPEAVPTPAEETQPEVTAEANEALNPNPAAAEEQPGEEVTVVEANEEAPTDPPAPAENEGETAQPDAAVPTTAEEPTLSKKELKAISNYNAVVDKVLPILSKRLKAVGALPITVDEATLTALDQEVEPEPTVESETDKGTRKNMKKRKNKNKRKNKRNNKRNNNMAAEEDARDNKRGNNKSVEKGNNRSAEKGNNRSAEKGNKGNKKNNKNKRKNKNNRRNKNRSNQPSRRPKAMDDDEEYVEEGRRKTSRNNNKNNKNRKQQKGGNKNKKGNNRRNKNKNNKGRSEIEAREDMGPVMPTPEERSASNARMTGLSHLSRDGDVTVDLTGKKHKVTAMVNLGPLTVNLKEKSRSLTKAEVTTNLQAVINFRVKAVSRRNKINVLTVEVDELTPEEVEVVRSDLDLEAEVISAAQQQVVSAVDTSRIARIIDQELVTIFDKDNLIENLENHPFLSE